MFRRPTAASKSSSGRKLSLSTSLGTNYISPPNVRSAVRHFARRSGAFRRSGKNQPHPARHGKPEQKLRPGFRNSGSTSSLQVMSLLVDNAQRSLVVASIGMRLRGRLACEHVCESGVCVSCVTSVSNRFFSQMFGRIFAISPPRSHPKILFRRRVTKYN